MTALSTHAVVFEQPGSLQLRQLSLVTPAASDLVVETEYTGISTGTERLLWEGRMPAFPGLGYPLVPGYETVGRVVQSGESCTAREGDRVFVPGAACYADNVRGLFGATASRLVVAEDRCLSVATMPAEQGVLLALAATAMHMLTHRVAREPGQVATLSDARDHAPQLIVGHGTLGRLLARLCVALGAPEPVVWETDPVRREGASDYSVIAMEDDDRRDYARACDVSGASGEMFNDVIARMRPAGEFVLGGFYSEPVSFDFPPAFMREVTLSIAAQWQPNDFVLVQSLIAVNALSLDGLVSHMSSVSKAKSAYHQAFNDKECLKMALDWRDS
jgi:3-hydroxyethyl bacteriochlorophyllide a dehydrogenase